MVPRILNKRPSIAAMEVVHDALSAQQIAQLERDLAEFKIASRELESELEEELVASEQRQAELERAVDQAQQEANAWKTRFRMLQSDTAAAEVRLHKQIETLQEGNSQLRQRLRAAEIENDDMERNGRVYQTSLETLEQRNTELVEHLAIAESEREERATLAEQLQRAKDELREAQEELHVSRVRNAPAALPPSRSLQKMNGILDQVGTFEDRLASVRRRLSTRVSARGPSAAGLRVFSRDAPSVFSDHSAAQAISDTSEPSVTLGTLDQPSRANVSGHSNWFPQATTHTPPQPHSFAAAHRPKLSAIGHGRLQ